MMMRHAFLAVALATSALAAAQAPPNTGRLEVQGTAPSACLIRTPAAATGVNATFEPMGASAGQIRITEVVDPATAQPRAASMDLAIPVICNGPHQVVLRSSNGGLRNAGAAGQSGPFTTFLPYRMDAVWGGSQTGVSSDGGPLLVSAAEGRAGALAISIRINPGGQPLVAGNYADQIVLELQAAN